MAAEHVGKHVTCPNCGQWCTVPDPGAESVKLRCRDCGTEHERDHKGECDACGSEDYDLWCAVHRDSVIVGTCQRCVEEHVHEHEDKHRAPAVTTVVSSPASMVPTSTTAVTTGTPAPPVHSPYSVSPTHRKPPSVSQPIGSAIAAMVMGIIAVAMLWCPLIAAAVGLAACSMGSYVYSEVKEGSMGKTAMPFTVAALVCGGLAIAISLGVMIASLFGS